MKFQANLTVTPQEIAKMLELGFPQYKVEVKKNPLLRFEYVQVAKSSFIGAWVRVKKDNTITVDGAVPSALVRGLLGGLLLIILTYSGGKKVQNEVAALLQTHLQ